jgi:hypothetical protein
MTYEPPYIKIYRKVKRLKENNMTALTSRLLWNETMKQINEQLEQFEKNQNEKAEI